METKKPSESDKESNLARKCFFTLLNSFIRNSKEG